MTERGSAEAEPLSSYLDGLGEPAGAILTAIADRARVLVPEAEEGMGYGMPALRYRGRPLLSVRETATHLSLFPFSAEVVGAVARSLDGYSVSTGTIRFSAEQPLPGDVIDRIVLLRRAEIDAALAR
jgi:uncharacterized protein YdhG (YjbR/CyaY superfamily)